MNMDTLNSDPREDDDPIVAEVRRIREGIAARFDYDIDRITEYARQESARVAHFMAQRRQSTAARQECERGQSDE